MRVRAANAALVCLTGMDAAIGSRDALASLPALYPLMPDLHLTESRARRAGALGANALPKRRANEVNIDATQPHSRWDPNPLPGPFWVFKLLLMVTFFLHILVMNAMLGGAVLALPPAGARAATRIGAGCSWTCAGKMPALLAATITLGIAPLLFVQVLYGQFFYTSSILMAWPWFLLLVFLVLAYYGLYIVASPG